MTAASVSPEPSGSLGPSRATRSKRKVSVSLDGDLVSELEAGGEALSSQVNEAVRNELGRRRRQRLLREMLDELEADHGPADEALVRKYMELLA